MSQEFLDALCQLVIASGLIMAIWAIVSTLRNP